MIVLLNEFSCYNGSRQKNDPMHRYDLSLHRLIGRVFPNLDIRITDIESIVVELESCPEGERVVVVCSDVHPAKYDFRKFFDLKERRDFCLVLFQQGWISKEYRYIVQELVDVLVTITPESQKEIQLFIHKIPVLDMAYIVDSEKFFDKKQKRKDLPVCPGRVMPIKVPKEFLDTIVENERPVDFYGPYLKEYWSSQDLPTSQLTEEYDQFVKDHGDVICLKEEVLHEQMNDVLNQYKVSLFPCPSEFFNVGIFESILSGCVPLAMNNRYYTYMGDNLPTFSSYHGMLSMASYILRNEDVYLFLRDKLQKYVLDHYPNSYYEDKLKTVWEYVVKSLNAKKSTLLKLVDREGDVRLYQYTKKGFYNLKVKSIPWMQDPEGERQKQLDKANLAKGKVLVAGLGLGIFQEYALKNPNVQSISTVEVSSDEIILMKRFKPELMNDPRHNIVCSDFYEYTTEERFDTIYGDIWEKYTDFEGFKKFKEYASRFLNEGGSVSGWISDQAV